MKATVTYAASDGTVHTEVIAGGHISVQTWDGGRARVGVHKRKGGKVVRAVHYTQVIVVDVDRRNRGA